MSDVEAQEHYDRFFEDVFLEMEDKVMELIFFNLKLFMILSSLLKIH